MRRWTSAYWGAMAKPSQRMLTKRAAVATPKSEACAFGTRTFFPTSPKLDGCAKPCHSHFEISTRGGRSSAETTSAIESCEGRPPSRASNESRAGSGGEAHGGRGRGADAGAEGLVAEERRRAPFDGPPRQEVGEEAAEEGAGERDLGAAGEMCRARRGPLERGPLTAWTRDHHISRGELSFLSTSKEEGGRVKKVPRCRAGRETGTRQVAFNVAVKVALAGQASSK